MDIFIKKRHVNIKHKSGLIKSLDIFGIRRALEVYTGDKEKELSLYMMATLVEEKGWWANRKIEVLLTNGDVYTVTTKYVWNKPFWKFSGYDIGKITYKGTDIAEIVFPNSIIVNKNNWQVKLFFCSGESFVISYCEYSDINRTQISIEKDGVLLATFDKEFLSSRRPSQIGVFSGSANRLEVFLIIPIYYFLLYHDYVEDNNIPS